MDFLDTRDSRPKQSLLVLSGGQAPQAPVWAMTRPLYKNKILDTLR